MNTNTIPCDVSGCGNPEDDGLHRPSEACAGCKAPQDHHAYRPAIPGDLDAALAALDRSDLSWTHRQTLRAAAQRGAACGGAD